MKDLLEGMYQFYEKTDTEIVLMGYVPLSSEPLKDDFIRLHDIFYQVLHVVRTDEKNEFIVKQVPQKIEYPAS